MTETQEAQGAETLQAGSADIAAAFSDNVVPHPAVLTKTDGRLVITKAEARLDQGQRPP